MSAKNCQNDLYVSKLWQVGRISEYSAFGMMVHLDPL